MPDDKLFQSLQTASWLIVTQLDRDQLVHFTLDALADFARTQRVSMFLADEDEETFTLVGTYHHGSIETDRRTISPKGTALADAIQYKEPRHFVPVPDSSVLLPLSLEGERICLCVPLLNGHEEVTGIITLEDVNRSMLTDHRKPFLLMLRTLIAISLENARLFHLAMVDRLTDVYVRRFFDVRLQEEMHRVRRYGGDLSLLVVDIDNFRSFNEQYGHACGDAVLSQCARVLKRTLRKNVDVICRYGGEEFGVILPETPAEGAGEISNRVRAACEAHVFSYKGQSHRITLSGGVVTLDLEKHQSEENLIENVTQLLQRSKTEGRNRIVSAFSKP